MSNQERLVQEVIHYLEKRNASAIVLENYIEQTRTKRKWTKAEILVLYKAIRETKLIFLDYVLVKKGERRVPSIRVNLI